MNKLLKIIFCSLFVFGVVEGRPHPTRYSFRSYPPKKILTDIENNIPPRLEWNANFGYCGEVSFISAGLYYGQYISQYDARAIASKNGPQNVKKSQLLIGTNDTYAGAQMHLNVLEWDSVAEQNTDQFLSWIKQNVINGYPVAIGVYTNEYLFYHDTNPDAGDGDYDHVVPVYGIQSTHPVSDPNYDGDDTLLFSDNGLWGNDTDPTFYYTFGFDACQSTREQANAANGPLYSLANDGTNYGVAITGVLDLNGDTLPVRLQTDLNDENPPMVDKSNTRPAAELLTLTITVSNLKPNVEYMLYKYNQMANVPNSNFNGSASQACEKWRIVITTGSTYTFKEQIHSDEIAVYRAVKATAP